MFYKNNYCYFAELKSGNIKEMSQTREWMDGSRGGGWGEGVRENNGGVNNGEDCGGSEGHSAGSMESDATQAIRLYPG